MVEDPGEGDQETDYEDEDNNDAPDHAPSPPDPSQPQPSTRRTRKGCQLVMDVLKYIKEVKHSTLATFLKEFSWGDRDCKQNCDCHFRMTRYRTQFFKSKHFPTIFERWCKPPRSSSSHRSRPLGGRCTIIPAAEALVRDELKRELKRVDRLFRSADMKLTRQGLTSTSIPTLVSQVKVMALKCWSLLSWLCGDDGEQRNMRDPSMVSHTAINNIRTSLTHFLHSETFSLFQFACTAARSTATGSRSSSPSTSSLRDSPQKGVTPCIR